MRIKTNEESLARGYAAIEKANYQRSKESKLSPHISAFNKLYFVNLFSSPKCRDFQEAKTCQFRLSQIAEKMNQKDLEYLIEKIEEIQ